MDKDLFEEFEFKPLTDGLGFSKKPETLKTHVIEEAPVKKKFDDVLATLEKSPLSNKPVAGLEFVDALPREPKMEKPKVQQQAAAMGSVGTLGAMNLDINVPTISPFPSIDVYKKIDQPAPKPTASTPAPQAQKQAPAIGVRRGGHDSIASNLEAVPASFASAFLDMIVIFALFLVFLTSLLLVTGVDLSAVINQMETNGATKVSMIVLFMAIMQIYVVLSRSLFGRTLGEWTFDMQVGKAEDQKNESYPLRILGRSLLVLVTGVITLPVLSLILNQDLAAKITGVQLYKQRM